MVTWDKVAKLLPCYPKKIATVLKNISKIFCYIISPKYFAMPSQKIFPPQPQKQCATPPPKKFFAILPPNFFSVPPPFHHLCVTFQHLKIAKKINQNRLRHLCVASYLNRLGNSTNHQ